ASSSRDGYTGSGTVYDPYLITTQAQLEGIAGKPSASYKLSSDLELNSSLAAIPVFYGILYGNNKELKINKAPVFQTNYGRIENLSIAANNLTLSTSGGALAVENGGYLYNITATGKITSEAANIGSLASINSGIIYQAETGVELSSSTGIAGGICAINNGSIYHALNTGSIHGREAAGIAAECQNASGSIYYSTNYGDINATISAGGIVTVTLASLNWVYNYGNIKTTNAGSVAAGIASEKRGTAGINQALNAGSVIALGANSIAGGIAGTNLGQVYNSLNTGSVYGEAYAGGIVGRNQALAAGGHGLTSYVINYGSVDGGKSVIAGSICGDNGKADTTSAELRHSFSLATGKPLTNGAGSSFNINEYTAAEFNLPAALSTFDTTLDWLVGLAPLPVLGYREYYDYAAVSSVGFGTEGTVVSVGTTVTLDAAILPKNATIKSTSWSSNNTGVATVSSSGIVTGVKEGTATITVTTLDGGNQASFIIEVIAGTALVFREGSDYAYRTQSGKVWTDSAYSFMIKDGRGFVPMRIAAMATDSTVRYKIRDNAEKVQLIKDGVIVEFQINGALVMRWNADESKLLDIYIIPNSSEFPFIQGGRAYLPARLMSEATGTSIDYAEDASGIYFVFSKNTLSANAKKFAIAEAKLAIL
ncbi:MAG: Ig-like domain-containing protein, partial [Oscillospiraceae bacterium]|nr:Ig-like domain-containing protein [Oscillospiraceae bacterium]